VVDRPRLSSADFIGARNCGNAFFIKVDFEERHG
jgi:hypothetical protein